METRLDSDDGRGGTGGEVVKPIREQGEPFEKWDHNGKHILREGQRLLEDIPIGKAGEKLFPSSGHARAQADQ